MFPGKLTLGETRQNVSIVACASGLNTDKVKSVLSYHADCFYLASLAEILSTEGILQKF